MPVLPIPMIIALLLSGLLVHRLVTRQSHWTLLALIAVCALQSAIIALVQYYGVIGMRPLQPVLAMVIPTVAWFAFARASGDADGGGVAPWHAVGPALALALLAVNPMLLDVLIPLSFTAYGAAMLLRMGRGEDSLQHSRLESGALPLLAWRIVAVSLMASAGCDVLIAYGLAFGHGGLLLWVPSLVSSLSLLSLGALSLSRAMESRREPEAEGPALTAQDAERDQAVMKELDDLMTAEKPYLDPELTLARLARRLKVPAKLLSGAINRARRENVSRYVNSKRIAHACALLASGATVTSVIYDSGFNTKSNFNREFLRVKGMPPSQWLEVARAGLYQPAP